MAAIRHALEAKSRKGKKPKLQNGCIYNLSNCHNPMADVKYRQKRGERGKAKRNDTRAICFICEIFLSTKKNKCFIMKMLPSAERLRGVIMNAVVEDALQRMNEETKKELIRYLESLVRSQSEQEQFADSVPKAARIVR